MKIDRVVLSYITFFINIKNWFNKIIGVEVDSFHSFDIDENFDFTLQEILIKNKNLFYEKKKTFNN